MLPGSRADRPATSQWLGPYAVPGRARGTTIQRATRYSQRKRRARRAKTRSRRAHGGQSPRQNPRPISDRAARARNRSRYSPATGPRYSKSWERSLPAADRRSVPAKARMGRRRYRVYRYSHDGRYSRRRPRPSGTTRAGRGQNWWSNQEAYSGLLAERPRYQSN